MFWCLVWLWLYSGWDVAFWMGGLIRFWCRSFACCAVIIICFGLRFWSRAGGLSSCIDTNSVNILDSL